MTTSSGSPAASGARIYKLVLLFDGSQVGRDDLQKKIEKALVQVPDKKLTVKKEGAKHVGVCIEGSLDVVDRCHGELSRNLLSREELRHFRLEDEAGDEIRLRAYPVLSAIEQQMRAFISRVRAEVYGFDDWKSGVPKKLQSKIVQPTETRRKGLSLDPLESTEFADLLDLLQARFPTWAQDRPLTPADMAELLSKSKTMDELRARFLEKTEVTSLWDSVFARYFVHPEDKEDLTRALRFVIEQRHKVMHHRPVRLGMLAELKKKREQIAALLVTAKKKLTPEERTVAKADGERVRSFVSDFARMREIWQQSVLVDPKLVEMLDRTREQAFSLSDSRFAQMLGQMQSTEMALKAVWNSEALMRAAADSESVRAAYLRMADAMKPYMETLMRERDRMAEVMNPYFETLMRERDRSVENHGSPAAPRSEPEDTESKRAQKDEDDKRIPT